MDTSEKIEKIDSLPPAAIEKRGFFRRHAAKLVASVIITGGVVYTIKKGGFRFIPEGGNFQGNRGRGGNNQGNQLGGRGVRQNRIQGTFQ